MPPIHNLNPNAFLPTHWQQSPLFIPNAFPNYTSPITPDELAGLATDPNVESRIVLERDGATPWELRHGPFTEADFANLPDSHWTLLVQAVDLWVPEVAKLLDHFDFLPRWRLDDIMISFAPPGGSVGPHFDQYDVFLLQVEGERLWQLGGEGSDQQALRTDTDLQILQHFEPQQEWLLTPGDMLYVPPKVAHFGVAQSDSLTFSIGFRSPLLSDMLGDLAIDLVAEGGAAHYRDPPLTPDMASNEIDPAFIRHAQAQLRALIDNEALLGEWFARYMTQAKYPDLTELTGEVREAQFNAKHFQNGAEWFPDE